MCYSYFSFIYNLKIYLFRVYYGTITDRTFDVGCIFKDVFPHLRYISTALDVKKTFRKCL